MSYKQAKRYKLVENISYLNAGATKGEFSTIYDKIVANGKVNAQEVLLPKIETDEKGQSVSVIVVDATNPISVKSGATEVKSCDATGEYKFFCDGLEWIWTESK